MIVLLRSLIGAVVILVLAGGILAQEPDSPPDPSGPTATASTPRLPTDVPVLDRADLVVRYYRVENPMVNAHQLMQAATAVFGRSFYVDDMNRRAAPARNFFVVGDALAVFETARRAEMIMKALPEMERAAAPSPVRGDPYVSEVVRLGHIPAHVASAALRPFYREPRSDVPNFVMTDSQGDTIVLRDRPEAVEEMKAVLALLDRPREVRISPTAIDLSCHVVRASDGPAPSTRLPEELLDNLSRLTGWKHFEDLGLIAVRASTGGEVQAEAILGDGHRVMLAFDDMSVSGETLHLGIVVFRLQGKAEFPLHSLKTSTEVSDGEYTVIGAFGSTPYFLVIHTRF